MKARVLAVYGRSYADFGPTLAAEKWRERDRIPIGDETLRLWLLQAGIDHFKRRKRPHRQWWERKAHRGEMLQIVGSHHPWFEERGPACVLMAVRPAQGAGLHRSPPKGVESANCFLIKGIQTERTSVESDRPGVIGGLPDALDDSDQLGAVTAGPFTIGWRFFSVGGNPDNLRIRFLCAVALAFGPLATVFRGAPKCDSDRVTF